MNKINSNQNTEYSLDLLYCQRIYYDRAKFTRNLIFILVIISTITIFFQDYNKTLTLINISFAFVIYVLIMLRDFFKKKGASFQQEFDYFTYDFKLNSYQKLNNTISSDEIQSTRRQKKIFKFKKEHLSNDSITDWYVNVSELDNKNTAILLCQLENLDWSYKLKKNYIIFIIIVSLVFIFVALVALADKKLNYLFTVIGAIPLTVYALDWLKVSFNNFCSTKNLRRIAENLFVKTLECEKVKIEDCMGLQNDIFESRKKDLMVPNYFYYIFKKIHEDVSESTKESRIKQLKEHYPGLFLSRRDIPK